MNKLLLLIFVFTSINCFSQEITKETWNNLFSECSQWEDEIKEYSGNSECHQIWFTIGPLKSWETEESKILFIWGIFYFDVFNEQCGFDKENKKPIYQFKNDYFRAGMPSKYCNGCKYMIEYWCNNCFDYNLESIKLRYSDKKK